MDEEKEQSATDESDSLFGFGSCRFCRQGNIDIGREYGTAAERDEAATLRCKCVKAEKYQKIQSEIRNADTKIYRLFGEGAKDYSLESADESIIKFLKSGARIIVDGKLQNIQVSIGGGESGRIALTASGKIRVERKKGIKFQLDQI